jgi:adenylate kinase family enzyme
MNRVLIIGISGAGKSTFGALLAARTGLPLIHLDREFWQPGWRIMPRDRWRAKVAELVSGDRWIVEGNYSATLDIRLPRADTVLWFDYPRRVALARIAKRIATTYGRVRSDMGAGCPEKLDLEFLRWVWNFPRQSRPLIADALALHGQHARLAVFRRDRDWRHCLDALPSDAKARQQHDGDAR